MSADTIVKDAAETPLPQLPAVGLPAAPRGGAFVRRGLILGAIGFALFVLDRIALVVMDYWLLQELGFGSVFWTNFRAGLVLILATTAVYATAIIVPAYVGRAPKEGRRTTMWVGLFVAFVAGLWAASHYRDFLLMFNAQPFGETDPVFGFDLGFFVFALPGLWVSWQLAIGAALALFVSSIVVALRSEVSPRPEGMGKRTYWVARAMSPMAVAGWAATGLLLVAGIWLSRYDLVLADNYASSVYVGAEALDVTGFFSTINGITVRFLAILALTIGMSIKFRQMGQVVRGNAQADWQSKLRPFAIVAVILPGIILDFGFQGFISLREQLSITPNEPVVQLEYIDRHVQATRAAWGLDDVETVEFTPKGPDDPLPDVDALLASPTLQNAPLWPGFNSALERLLDPQHAERVFLTDGDPIIYAPTLDMFRQQQKLRPYYNFLDIDTVRYNVGGVPQLFASAVRELPLLEPQPWLAWWGQQFVLFTHGFGLTATHVSDVDTTTGQPIYASSGVPAVVTNDALAVDNERIYYGEGLGSMAYSNIQGVDEFDFPTDQGRAETRYAEGVGTGVPVDSFFKRLVLGYKSRQFFDIFFSDLINDDTRVHYFRTPLERIEHVAPFLYLDTDPYAVSTGETLTWMVNGMSVSDHYPYSQMVEFGDKSIRRSPTVRPFQWVNYAKDSVKATIDAYTGEVTLYKIADEPVINTWAVIYPDLFVDGDDMPEQIQDQRQYPTQLFHAQFDDLFIFYHMDDPIEFFNLEDLWDDGDEVLGPIIDTGDAITFSIEPYFWIAETGGEGLPESPGPGTQFAVSLIYTPENATNLRAVVTAYQERNDYGRLIAQQIPKGTFYLGPEQADSAIDQDAEISAQFSLWNREGTEVIRGHTTPLVIDGEVLYVEPIFIRSQQNPTPQLKRVVVVFRGAPAMGITLEEALRKAVAGGPSTTVFEDAANTETGGPPPNAGTEEGEDDSGPPPGRGPGSDDS